MLKSPNLNWLKRFMVNLSDSRAFVFSFVLGFTIRLIPELLSYPNPIGFDTVMYAAKVKSGVIWSSWTAIFSVWLFDGLLISVNKIVQVDPFNLLKVVVPLLYALNVSGIYHFSRKALNWSVKTSLTAAFFFAFQLASLRMSWDLDKNLLGSAILLFTLPLIKGVETKKNFVMSLTLSLLLVLSHILVAVVLFTIVLATFIGDWLKCERLKSLKLLVAALPGLAVLLISLFVFPSSLSMPRHFVDSKDTVHQSSGGLSFMVNYIGVADPVQSYPTYPDLVLHIFSLFSLLYLWWLPLVLVGFFRDRILDSWTLLLLFGSFNALITPFCALDLWNRWMFMLVYPFTFYAIQGVEKLSRFRGESIVSGFKLLNWMKVSRKTVWLIFSLTVVFGSVFFTMPPFFDRFGLFLVPTTSPYFPSTMLYNSIPLRDVRPAMKVFEWLNLNMNDSSSLLVHRAFMWWADLYLDKKHPIVYFVRDFEKASGTALERGFDPIYVIWWNENYVTWQNQSIDWYGLTVPKYFKYVFSSDRISVLQYSRD